MGKGGTAMEVVSAYRLRSRDVLTSKIDRKAKRSRKAKTAAITESKSESG